MSSPSVAVIVPWRLSPGRSPATLAVACRALTEALPEAEALLADSLHEPFNRAASRNAGVVPADTLVFCDADAIVEPEPLRAAVTAAGDGKLHLPFTDCRLLTEHGTRRVLDGEDPTCVPSWRTVPNSVGGCVVVAYDTWLKVGGWDERFTSWGFEDTAFWCAVDTLFGTVRHDGVLNDMWHPDGRGIGSPAYIAGKALCDRYTDARGDRDAIQGLIEERAWVSSS